MNETMNIDPMIAAPNRRGLGLTLTTLAVAGGLTLAACGNSGEGMSLQDDVATSTTGAEATSTTTAERTPVLDGSDYTIAADAKITRCGVDGSLSTWSANAEAYILNQEANQDLLRSKEQVLFSKIGVNAANILADKAFTYDDVDQKYVESDSLYTRIVARGDAVKMTDAAVTSQPVRENYRCQDDDNDGVGDESIYRDNRANRNNGENVTLLALTLSPEDWKLAVDAAYAEGIDLNAVMLTQTETVTALDADGKEVSEDVVRVFFEDDSCGNQVFKTPPEQTPTPTTTTVVTSTPTTLPPITVVTTLPPYIPPKTPDTTPTPGGMGSGGSGQEADPSQDNNDGNNNGYDQVSEAQADPDNDGLHNDVDQCDNEAETYNGYQDEDGCPDVAPVVTQPTNVVTGTAPTSTNPPVVASTVAPAPPVVTAPATTTTIGADND